MSTGEPAATESGHGWFGGGPSEKDQVNWHLVGGLPYRTPGFGGRLHGKGPHPSGAGPHRAAHPTFSLDASGWSGRLQWCLAGLGEDVEDGGGGRGGLGGPSLVPGGDVPSAERGQGADGHLSRPEG
jgi:hypothetical protein